MATGGWALALHADFEDIRQECSSRQGGCPEGSALRDEALDLADDIHRFALATDIMLGLAAATAVTSFALMLLNREVSDESRVTIALAPVPGGAVASLAVGGMTRW